MRDDQMFRSDLHTALSTMPVPPIDFVRITAKRHVRAAAISAGGRSWNVVVAACALAILVILPFSHPSALLAAAQSDVVMLLNVLGIHSGPKIDRHIVEQLKAGSHRTNETSAAKQVAFTLVAPSGLPVDARQTRIDVSATGSWSAKTQRWAVGDKVVIYQYRRASGNTFVLRAEPYHAQQAFDAYLWEQVEDAHGDPIVVNGKVKLIRHQQFFWRNGDQMMSAVTGDGISVDEIEAIRKAMGGAAIATVRTTGPHGGRLLVVHP